MGDLVSQDTNLVSQDTNLVSQDTFGKPGNQG